MTEKVPTQVDRLIEGCEGELRLRGMHIKPRSHGGGYNIFSRRQRLIAQVDGLVGLRRFVRKLGVVRPPGQPRQKQKAPKDYFASTTPRSRHSLRPDQKGHSKMFSHRRENSAENFERIQALALARGLCIFQSGLDWQLCSEAGSIIASSTRITDLAARLSYMPVLKSQEPPVGD